MSAAPDRAAARCACTNISLMQLFHELKQKFPGAPDHAVSGAIAAFCHDKRACETHLESQAEASLTHAYHASSSAAARRLKDLRDNFTPLECRNRPLETRNFPLTASVQPHLCQKPQNAELSEAYTIDDSANIEAINEPVEERFVSNTNPGLVEALNDILKEEDPVELRGLSENSPITINIDNCIEKSCETPSDIESDEVNRRQRGPQYDDTSKPISHLEECASSTDSANYKILKSNKIKSNLPERLEKTKEKKVVVQRSAENQVPETPTAKETSPEKPKRPCTLEFIKPQPDLNLKRQTIPEPTSVPCKAVSPAAAVVPPPLKERTPGGPIWPEQGYPLNLSVNVNVDILNRQLPFYQDPWLEDYESPRAFTSVNLTVCTPTAAMQSPVREAGGFEGHLTVTVSPSTVRAPRRPAPAPPSHLLPTTTQEEALNASKDGISGVWVTGMAAAAERALLARQRERKAALVAALAKERERLRRVEREVAVLRAPPPPPAAERRLRDQLEQLRAQCQHLIALQPQAQGLEREEAQRATPSRPAPPPPDEPPKWQCRVCTFENHGELNMCEQCDMLRNVELGTRGRGGGGAGGGGALLLGAGEPLERQAGRACV